MDIDADGDLDIHVCYYDAPNELFINDGKGRFEEKAEEFGLNQSDASLIASFCDYDQDGDLDCFLLTRDFKRPGGFPKEAPVVKTKEGYQLKPGFEKFYAMKQTGQGNWTYVNAGREDYLLRNDGGKFVDVSKKAGISGRDREIRNLVGFNNDGLADLYVGNDFKDADRLYQNMGDGTFKDVIRDFAPHTPWFAMGADSADLDGDGRQDLLIADMAGTNHYWSKTTIVEAKFEDGICYPRRGFSCSSSAMPTLRTKLRTFENFANSTLSDLYSTTRLSKAIQLEARVLESCLFLNDGTGRFEMKPLPRMAQLSPSNCVVLEDLDGDGKVDCLLGQNFYGAQPEVGHHDAGLSLLLKRPG